METCSSSVIVGTITASSSELVVVELAAVVFVVEEDDVFVGSGPPSRLMYIWILVSFVSRFSVATRAVVCLELEDMVNMEIGGRREENSSVP